MRSAVPASITPAATSSCSSRCEIGMAAPNMRGWGGGDRAGAALDEEPAARRGVEVPRCGDIPPRPRDPTPNVLAPYVPLTARADARFRRATKFDRRGGAPAPGTGVEGAAAAAAQAVGAVAESEGAPEPVARRGLLCRGELHCTQREHGREQLRWALHISPPG